MNNLLTQNVQSQGESMFRTLQQHKACLLFVFIKGQSLPSGDLLFCKVIDYLVQLELNSPVKQTSRRSD